MNISRKSARLKRKIRIRKKINGRADIPRLVVFRSNKHIYAQIINDEQGATLAASSTLTCQEAKGRSKLAAGYIGKDIAEKAKEQSISSVVFDRNGYYYHGRIKALADGAREAGLKF